MTKKSGQQTLIQINDGSSLSITELVKHNEKSLLIPNKNELNDILKEKCQMLSQAVDHLQNQLNIKEEEILMLKSQINQSNTGLITMILPSEEELIIESQIRILKNNGGLQKEMSLDEIKKLDLLIKNKKLVKTPDTPIESENSLSNKSQSELIKIASKGKA